MPDGSGEDHGAGPVVLDPDAIAAGRDALDIGDGGGDAPPGTYALILRVDPAATVEVGALGAAEFPPGAYAYVGSAFGSNGLGRVDRHRRVADGVHDVRHWHVDHLGGHPAASLAAVVAVPRVDIECRLATEIRRRSDDSGVPVSGFGASDCGCPGHLVADSNAERLRTAAIDAVESVRPP